MFTLGAGLPALAAARDSAQRPNFVVMFVDDLGYGDLSCYGHPTIRTPNLDQMARDGVRFTQFYVAAAVCSPSRAALLTGRLPVRTGVNVVFSPWSKGGLPAEEVTVAQALKGVGYRTACVGKWHLGSLPQYLPTRRGFDSYFGIPYSNDMSKATNPRYVAGHPETPGTPLMRDERMIEEEPDQSELTARYTAESIKIVKESAAAKRPFFLYLAHSMPHTPISASKRFLGKSARGLYGDVVEELDWSVGEVRRTLRELKLERNTLVAWMSDNGPWLVQRENGGSAGPLREGKGSQWEGGFREPAIFAWPGRIKPGQTCLTPASTMDLLPTMLKLAKAPLPEGKVLDGEDLMPVLLGGNRSSEFTLFYYAGGSLRAARSGPWKLVLPQAGGLAGRGGGAAGAARGAVGGAAATAPAPELYHLEHDPSERFNKASEQSEVVARLTQIIEEHRRTLKPGPPQT
jgi:arylsulfatase